MKDKEQRKKAIQDAINEMSGGKPWTEEELMKPPKPWGINQRTVAKEILMKKVIAPYLKPAK